MSGRLAFQLLKRALRLKCPRCGEGRLFQGFFAMHRECQTCHLGFEREQGYFIGAIYVNYAVTVLIVIPGYFLLDYGFGPSLFLQLCLWIPFATIFPLCALSGKQGTGILPDIE
jgi:uncharacterized protein (DUF983 family)